MDKICLSSGYVMPVLGLGTWQAASEAVMKAVLSALDVGYRHIDTAYNYKNEQAIGDALKQWLKDDNTRSREELFITTKLPHYANRPKDVGIYLDKSLSMLGLSYVDLYLVHMPFTMQADKTGDAPAKNDDGTVVLETSDHLAVWREMENQVALGKVRSIGVSNFNQEQVERLYATANISPACLQIEMHAALQQRELREACAKRNIAVTAFCPLGSPGSKQHFMTKYQIDFEIPDLLNNATILNLAEEHKRTPAQIMLRHLVQLGVAVIPKSTTRQHIEDNSKIFDFDLTSNQMEEMNKLDSGTKGRIMNFLFFKGVEKHPEYPFPNEMKHL